MPGLPAVCDKCLTVWDPHVVNLSHATDVHIQDVTVGPCPNCGGTGHIPDGIYSATTDTIRVMVTTAKSAESLRLLAQILRRARDQSATREELAKSLDQAPTEDFKPFADLVRGLPKKIAIKDWIAIALAVAALLQGQATDRKVDRIEAQVNQIYAQMLAHQPTPSAAQPTATASAVPYPKVWRNDPCPCGSGKKYKRCHGA